VSEARTPLLIFGAGPLARLAHDYCVRDGAYDVRGFTVHERYLGSSSCNDLEGFAFERLERNFPPDTCVLFVAVGYTHVNRVRARLVDECRARGYRLASIVSKRAHLWPDLELGENCFVFDAVVVEPGVTIGDGVILWSGSQVSHDAVVGAHCFLAPNAVVLGEARLGDRCFVGGNATVRNGITLAEDTVVGAGAVIMRDSRPGEIYAAAATAARAGENSSELADL
jgi:sugar O-acyltransferase (sialic acid O-acetyltransferase NeuD family)